MIWLVLGGKDERLWRFFFGLDVDFSWDETLLLIRVIWAVFGIDKKTPIGKVGSRIRWRNIFMMSVWRRYSMILEQALEATTCQSLHSKTFTCIQH